MKAIVLRKTGGPEVLQPTEILEPKPGKGEVLVKVQYAGLNYAEILSRKGLYGWAGKRPYILGMEASGVVEEIGQDVGTLKVGQKVMIGTKSGAYAEKIVIPEDHAAPVVESYTMEENASFLVNYMTAWVSLVTMAKIAPGDTVLITASAGGVGTAAVQIASKMGCKVYGMASSKEKINLIKSIGATEGYNYRNPECYERIVKDTGGVDIVLEMVGGQVFKRSLDIVNPFGTIVVAGFASLDLKKWNPFSWIKTWRDIPRVNVGDLAKKSIAIMSSHLGYLLEEEPDQMETILNDLINFVEQHNIKPIVGRIFSFEDAARAHEFIESRQSTGKVLLEIGD